jgi:glyoxylase-like metal-dependent hydrolase (beta-lactamase superfamily II)
LIGLKADIAMTPSFRVGDLEIYGYSDGLLKTSLDLVVNMERARSEALVGGTDKGWLFIPVNCFVFQRDGKTILIDAGAGNTMQPTLGKLAENLRAGGIEPGSVDTIVITHIHPDHANGLVDDNGEAVYPNAEILVHALEYDFWMAENTRNEPEKVKAIRDRNKINMKPYVERTRRMRDGEEVLGCTPILAAGHSPGHACWRIMSGGQSFLAWGDLVHLSAIQISHPDTALTYDLDNEMACRSRRRILDLVANERIVVAGAHVNAPGFGHVVRKGATYAFESA